MRGENQLPQLPPDLLEQHLAQQTVAIVQQTAGDKDGENRDY